MMTEANVLPPKTCTIDRLITKEEDIERVVKGEKTSARRNGRYADIGETFSFDDRTYEVTRVYQQSLGELTDAHARMEGFDTVDAYREYIQAIHPGMPWLPHMQVWVHEFAAQ